MRNSRTVIHFFRKFALPMPPRTSSLSEIYTSLAVAWDSESGRIELATASTRPARSGDEENLLRVRILDLATRLVARHIDVTAVGIVRTKNVPGFAGNGLRHRELRRRI